MDTQYRIEDASDLQPGGGMVGAKSRRDYQMNQKEYFNKNLLREFICFVFSVIFVFFIIGWCAMMLYYHDLLGTGFLIEHQVSGDRHLIGTKNVNVLVISFFITLIIWIIRMLRAKSVK